MKTYYQVKTFDGASYADISKEVKDYGTDSVDITLLNAGFLYVGLYKPFCQFYAELEEKNLNANEFSAEYYDKDSASWKALTILDETNGFTQSGFIKFERPFNWGKSTVDSAEGFYIRLKPSVDHSASKLQGLSVLFSNDLDLEGIRSNIVSKHNGGESWILKHEAAKKMIIQNIRNLGYRKAKTRDDNATMFFNEANAPIMYYNITEFDFLEPEELREASKFLALSMIYLDELTDEADDKYERAGLRHEKSYEQSLDLFYMKLDLDDDGLEDDYENAYDTRTLLTWQ